MSLDRTTTLPASLKANPRLDRWLRFCSDGSVEVRTGKVELGQGILTALAQIAADELDVPLDRVRVLAADTANAPDEAVTSGSRSVQDSGAALRQVCAEARALHLAEAARRWQVAPSVLRVQAGVIGAEDGRRCTYVELADAALLAAQASGGTVPKRPAQHHIVGQSVPRRQVSDTVAGRARYIHDLVLDGILHGRVLHPPHADAELVHSDSAPARALDGVHAVVQDGRLFGVLADSTHHVEQARARLARSIEWRDGARLPDRQGLAAWLRRQPVDTQPVDAKGEVPDAQAMALRASYSRPYLAHASIAPSCALARFESSRLEVWTHSQGIFNLRRDLALAFALPEDAIVVRHVEGAGCYGHNGADDVAWDAAWLARAVPGRPVRVLWSREDELARAPFGPAMAVDLAADVDAAGRIVAWRHAVWSNGHSARPGRAAAPALLGSWSTATPFAAPPAMNMPLASGGGAERNAIPCYDFAAWRIDSHRVLTQPLRTSALRALGAHLNTLAIEAFIDEIAQKQGVDAVEFRLRHLSDPRARRVIEQVAARAGWHGRARRDNIGHGIGYTRYKTTAAYCAVIAEIEAAAEIRVRRLTIAVDVGEVVNPDGVIQQIEGGAIQATSWTLKEAVCFDAARVTSNAWEHYPILRFSEVPAVDVDVLASDAPSVGAGEASVGPTAAAIVNAVFDALGVRVRDLPLTAERIVAAIDAAG
jgi:nicotinate dehydrogenase subunit B